MPSAQPSHANESLVYRLLCPIRWQSSALLLLVNNLIAVILIVGDARTPYWHYFIIANLVGFFIHGSGNTLEWLFGKRLPAALNYLLATPIGCALGFKLATYFGTADVLNLVFTHFSTAGVWILLSTSLMAFAATGFFYVYHRGLDARLALETERRQRAEAQQSEAAAKLGLLQAQIEPHFLFNTLANVQSLIERDPPAARAMLEQLNRYLRASLTRTRQPINTLAEELQLVSALLEIAQMRLGQRLQYRINIPDDLHAQPLPPLLLQPLVENALEHGIEPAIAGGEIIITGQRSDESFVLCVCDNGIGMQHIAGDDGVGLANIRARLDQRYGAIARLALYPNSPSGVIAELTLPLDANADHAASK